MNELELLSIGDATWDVFIEPSETETLCELRSREEFVCFSYGDKIPVKELNYSVGGNAANNSVGATRLGVKAAPVINLGNDEIADQILSKFEKEGVDARFISREEKGTSNFSTIINYGGERTIFTYKGTKRHVLPEGLPETPWIYLTSMSEEFRTFYDEFVPWLKERGDVKLAYNPGSRQLRVDRSQIEDVLSLTYMLYVNRAEGEKIAGFSDSKGKEKELLEALSKLGPKLPIITDGSKGSYVFDSEQGKFYHAGVLPVDAYERTGAGDAFGSGCISALIKGKSFEEALLWGTLNSASVIGYVGSQRGLLKEEQMQEWLDRAKSSEVKVSEI